MFDNTDTHDYKLFLKTLIDNNYQSCFFNEIHKFSGGAVALRHDIDFDCELAYQMAVTENEFKIKATYFFLISSESYNIASRDNYEYIRKIKELGHAISIHFDPVIYNDFERAFKNEVSYFENLFDTKINIVSIHRPNDFFIKYDQPINGIEHTYQSKYFSDLKYFSDSTGIWRFGHPFNSKEFNEKMNLHILVHPIWWMITPEIIGNVDKIKLHYLNRMAQLKKHYLVNCKPFSEIYDQI